MQEPGTRTAPGGSTHDKIILLITPVPVFVIRSVYVTASPAA